MAKKHQVFVFIYIYSFNTPTVGLNLWWELGTQG